MPRGSPGKPIEKDGNKKTLSDDGFPLLFASAENTPIRGRNEKTKQQIGFPRYGDDKYHIAYRHLYCNKTPVQAQEKRMSQPHRCCRKAKGESVKIKMRPFYQSKNKEKGTLHYHTVIPDIMSTDEKTMP